MSVKEIRKHNSQTFLDDLKRVVAVYVYSSATKIAFPTTKQEVRRHATYASMTYKVSSEVLRSGDVMVIY